MLVKRFQVGFKLLPTNCYLVADEETSEAVVIDPGFRQGQEQDVLREISDRNLRVKCVVNTHGHPDHVSGNDVVKQATNSLILIHKKDAKWLTNPSSTYAEAMIEAGLSIEKPDFPCLECGKDALRWEFHNDVEKMILECGACDFFQEYLSLSPPDRLLNHGDIIKIGGRELSELPDHTIVYSGDGERTTIGKIKREKRQSNARGKRWENAWEKKTELLWKNPLVENSEIHLYKYFTEKPISDGESGK